MLPPEPLPLYDKLRERRATNEIGLRAAQLTGSAERIAWYQQSLAEVERKIEALRRPIYTTSRRDDLRALRLAYAAHQVTPREFALRMWGLLRP
jgi:hypothetical protein